MSGQELLKSIENRSPYLVFISAGDRARLHPSLREKRNFDLWITYYGAGKHDRYRDIADYYNRSRGSKFINFHGVYHAFPGIFRNYRAIFLPDDDLYLKARAIDRLFQIRETRDLWIIQPSFDPRGKISHSLTRSRPFTLLHHTNFIEVTCPLFRKDKLDLFMRSYDGSLAGGGIDYWYSSLVGKGQGNKLAVIDVVSCINPNRARRGEVREIDRFQTPSQRAREWETIRRRLSLPGKNDPKQTYKVIGHDLRGRDIIHSLMIAVLYPLMECSRFFYRLRRRIVRLGENVKAEHRED